MKKWGKDLLKNLKIQKVHQKIYKIDFKNFKIKKNKMEISQTYKVKMMKIESKKHDHIQQFFLFIIFLYLNIIYL